MPSVPESGNNSVVDSKTRPNGLKIPEANKYTDVTRTSSASFKPPMSKDALVKKKTDTPQADSTWFTPLFYIKNMFGGKPSSESSTTVTKNSDKNKKVPTVKNTSNTAKAKLPNMKEAVESHTSIPEEARNFMAEAAPPVPIKADHSPRFSFNPQQATTRRAEKKINKKPELEEEVDPNAPKYNALRFVENKSTYLHAPDKKGTTSFRITTSSRVRSRPNSSQVMYSPNYGNGSSKRARKSPVFGRQSSASPKKIPYSDNGSTANFPSRLRSKSTPDHSSVKPHLVSDPTCPKSLSLKHISNKITQPNQNDVNANRAEFTDVKPSSKQSFHMKPTILDGSKPFPKFASKKNPSQPSKSSLQIGAIPSPKAMPMSRSSSALLQSSQLSYSNRSEKGSLKAAKSNTQRPATYAVSNKSNVEKAPVGRKSPIIDSPTLIKPAAGLRNTSQTRTQVKECDPLTKFANAQQRAKDRIRSRMDTQDDNNKLTPHKMVLPAAVDNITSFSSRSGLVVNNENNSPRAKILRRKEKQCAVKDISPTIAESPVRRPSPPGVMCLTSQNVNSKKRPYGDDGRKIVIQENELKPSLLPSYASPPMSPIRSEIECPGYPSYPVHTSSSSGILPECCANVNAVNECSRSYVDSGDEDDDNTEPSGYAFNSDCTERLEEDKDLQVSNAFEFNDVSNSACCCDDHWLEGFHCMDMSDYEVDTFSNAVELEQDTCNSALSRKAITSRSGMQPSFLVSETEDTEIFESSCGPTVIFQRNAEETEFLPFQKDIDSDSINFFTEENSKFSTPTHLSAAPNAMDETSPETVPNCRENSRERSEWTTRTSRRMSLQSRSQRDIERDTRYQRELEQDGRYHREVERDILRDRSFSRSPAPVTSSGRRGESPKARPVSNDKGKRRRFPFDVDRSKMLESAEAAKKREIVLQRTPIIKKAPPTETASSHSVIRLHSSPYVAHSTAVEKQTGTSHYLESLTRNMAVIEDVPTKRELDITTATPERSASPHRSKYKRTSPDITFSGIASSVGEALNSFADTIKNSLPGTQKNENESPVKREIQPTTLSDNPLGSTMTYISSSLEEKGLSPLPWPHSNTNVQTHAVKEEKHEEEKREVPKVQVDERPLKYRLDPFAVEPSIVTRSARRKSKKKMSRYTFENIDTENPIGSHSPIKEIAQQLSAKKPEVKKTESSRRTDIKKAEVIKTEIIKGENKSGVFGKDITDKISLAPVTEGLMKTFEDTKNYLVSVFSPPVKKVQLDKTKKESGSSKDILSSKEAPKKVNSTTTKAKQVPKVDIATNGAPTKVTKVVTDVHQTSPKRAPEIEISVKQNKIKVATTPDKSAKPPKLEKAASPKLGKVKSPKLEKSKSPKPEKGKSPKPEKVKASKSEKHKAQKANKGKSPSNPELLESPPKPANPSKKAPMSITAHSVQQNVEPTIIHKPLPPNQVGVSSTTNSKGAVSSTLKGTAENKNAPKPPSKNEGSTDAQKTNVDPSVFMSRFTESGEFP